MEGLMEGLMKKLQKEFGELNVRLAVDIPLHEVITTGSATLDFATRVGGIPRGALVELFGPPGLGKTTLAYHMIAAEQRLGNQCVFINLESTFSAQWAEESAGVDISKLILVEPNNGEEASAALASIVNFKDSSGQHVGLIVFDSIGAILAASETEEDGKSRVGGQAKLITHMVNRIIRPADMNKVTVVFLNQVRDNIGFNAHGFKTPGGWAMEHECGYRFQLKPAEAPITDIVHDQRKEIGRRVTAVIKKSKYATYGAAGEFTIYHDKDSSKVRKVGIDQEREVLDLAIAQRIIERNGSYYTHPSFPDDGKGQHRLKSKDEVIEYTTQNLEIIAILRKELMELARA